MYNLPDLSEEDREQSVVAESQGRTFINLMFEDLLKNGRLAHEVRTQHPARYRELKAAYEVERGLRPRPDEFWHTLKGGQQ
jgi:hypothetical protein